MAKRKPRERPGRRTGIRSHQRPPETPLELDAWLKSIGIRIARHALLQGPPPHDAPFDYLAHSFFGGHFARVGERWVRCAEAGPVDAIVWANRGGGKTFVGAVATLCDAVFKPGLQTRLIAGSLEQAGHMYEHLLRLVALPGVFRLVKGEPTGRRIRFKNGAAVQLLAASERSVRGTRVHRIRCDEVDLFDPKIWRAVQLTTHSLALPGPWGKVVAGGIDAISTMQVPYGLMWRLVTGEPGQRSMRRLFRWSIVDVLEACTEEHVCDRCGLFDACGGRAKLRSPSVAGHVSIEDALTQMRRVDAETWRAEMLCERPRQSGAVYPEFDRDRHVVGDEVVRRREVAKWYVGLDFGFAGEAVALLASIDTRGVVLIEREISQKRRTVAELAASMREWPVVESIAAVFADPAGNSSNEQTGRSSVGVVRAAGFVVRTPRSSVFAGIQLVRVRLAPALAEAATPMAIEGRMLPPPPTLLVHQRCERLISCLTRYRYVDGSAQPNKVDGVDHACDALRYLVVGLDLNQRTRVHSYL